MHGFPNKLGGLVLAFPILLLAAGMGRAFAQDPAGGGCVPPNSPGRDSTVQNIWRGLQDSISPWDVSIVLIAFAGKLDAVYSEHHIDFPSIDFDTRITDAIARDDGGFTLGSRISPDGLSWTTILAQFAVTSILDEFSDKNISEYDYGKVFTFSKAVLLNMYITELVKSAVSRVRPDGTDARSFFSGHASATFTYSSFLYRELDDWLDIAFPDPEDKTKRGLTKGVAFAITYGWASYVGYSRIYDRRHYLTDVLAGAAVGTVIGNLAYSSWSKREAAVRGETPRIIVQPAPSPSVSILIQLGTDKDS